jgi:hypothetical protein
VTAPRVGSHVSVQVFAQDLLAHQGLIRLESYPSSGYVSVLLDDGGGVRVAVTGNRAGVQMVLEAALDTLAADEEAGQQP